MQDKTFFSLSDLIDEGFYQRPVDRWPTYDGKNLDRSKYVTSSQVGLCPRWVKYDKQTPPSPPTKKYKYGQMERGKASETWTVEQLRRVIHNDFEFIYLGDEQVSFYHGVQSGTPDGLAIHRKTRQAIVLEFKNIDPRTNISRLPKPSHADQTMQNMDLVQECLDMPVMGSKLLYTDAADYDNRYEFFIPYEGERAEALEAKAKKIMAAKSPEELPPEGMAKGECTYCPFGAQCSAAVKARNANKEQDERNARLASAIFGQR